MNIYATFYHDSGGIEETMNDFFRGEQYGEICTLEILSLAALMQRD